MQNFKIYILNIFKSTKNFIYKDILLLDDIEKKNKRVITLVCFILMIVFLFFRFVSGNGIFDNAYEIFLNDEYISIIEKSDDVSPDIMLKEAIQNIYETYGDNIEIDESNLVFNSVHKNNNSFDEYEVALSKLINNITFIELGYSIFINDVEKIIMESEEIANQVILDTINQYVNESTTEVFFEDDIVVKKQEDKFLRKFISYEDAFSFMNRNIVDERVYIVKENDTLWDISWKFDTTVQEILDKNPNLNEESILNIGDEIKIDSPKPFIKVVTFEEIVYNDIAPKKIISQENENEYKTFRKVIQPGEDGEKIVTEKIEFVNGIEVDRYIIDEEIIVQPIDEIVEIGTLNSPPKHAIGTFINPTTGTFTSGFGFRNYRNHFGIDIASSVGTPIYASDGGEVIFSGWEGSYGYLIIIDHKNGFKTYYAHNSSNHVTVNTWVAQGQLIASMGNTGNSTGSHLHFEVRLNDVPKNPLDYLSF